MGWFGLQKYLVQGSKIQITAIEYPDPISSEQQAEIDRSRTGF